MCMSIYHLVGGPGQGPKNGSGNLSWASKRDLLVPIGCVGGASSFVLNGMNSNIVCSHPTCPEHFANIAEQMLIHRVTIEVSSNYIHVF